MPSMSEQLILLRLGQQIRRLRQCLSISQEELAARAGVHRTYIGMIERGEKNITIVSMTKIALALNIEIYDLLKDSNNGK